MIQQLRVEIRIDQDVFDEQKVMRYLKWSLYAT